MLILKKNQGFARNNEFHETAKKIEFLQKNKFLFDINTNLNLFLVDYELKVDQDILQQYVVTDNIYEDGLTKDALFKTIKRVFKAKLHCIMLLNYDFGNSNNNNSKPHNENSMFV